MHYPLQVSAIHYPLQVSAMHYPLQVSATHYPLQVSAIHYPLQVSATHYPLQASATHYPLQFPRTRVGTHLHVAHQCKYRFRGLATSMALTQGLSRLSGSIFHHGALADGLAACHTSRKFSAYTCYVNFVAVAGAHVFGHVSRSVGVGTQQQDTSHQPVQPVQSVHTAA